MGVARVVLILVFQAAMQSDKATGTESVNMLLVLLTLIFSVILILICRLKYQNKMISSMADYEYVKEKLPYAKI